MRIFIKVKPNSNQERVEKMAEDLYKVWVKEPPEKGKANKAVIGALANYFKVSKSQVKISAGLSSKNKVIEVKK